MNEKKDDAQRTVIDSDNIDDFVFDINVVTHTTAGGATGKKNVVLHVDVEAKKVIRFARGELQRDLNKICRESIATVDAIKQATEVEPWVLRASDIVKGTGKVDVKKLIEEALAKGMSAEQILETLTK